RRNTGDVDAAARHHYDQTGGEPDAEGSRNSAAQGGLSSCPDPTRRFDPTRCCTSPDHDPPCAVEAVAARSHERARHARDAFVQSGTRRRNGIGRGLPGLEGPYSEPNTLTPPRRTALGRSSSQATSPSPSNGSSL